MPSSPNVRYGVPAESAGRFGLPCSWMLDSLPAIDDAPVNIGKDEKDHAADHSRDEKFIEERDVVHEREMFRAGLIVAHPCIREIRGCIRVTVLAFHQQVFTQ